MSSFKHIHELSEMECLYLPKKHEYISIFRFLDISSLKLQKHILGVKNTVHNVKIYFLTFEPGFRTKYSSKIFVFVIIFTFW
jgi:hypothetical protein